MTSATTVSVADATKQLVQEAAQVEGISPGELIDRAVREHVFLRQFRSLSDRLAAQAEAQGIKSDEDVCEHSPLDGEETGTGPFLRSCNETRRHQPC